MYNSEHKNGHPCAPMSPRISFSNDFVDSSSSSHQSLIHQQDRISRDTPVSSDFEFSVTNYSMMSADELFFKGRLLPLKDTCNHHHMMQMQRTTTTLREELLHHHDFDDEYQDLSNFRPPKPSSSSSRRKGFLGLRKAHFGSRKSDKPTEPSSPSSSSSSSSSDMGGVEGRRSRLVNETGRDNELLNEGGSSF